MFKMFAHDPIVLGMDTMFEPKHRYLGDKDTYIDLESLHFFTCKWQPDYLMHAKKWKGLTLGRIHFPKLEMLFCSETITKQVLLPIFCLDIMLFKKLMTVTIS